jgi:hypothetical protein
VWQSSSCVAVLFLLAVASLRLLGTAAAISASLAAAATRAWRSHGRHGVRQRSSRLDVLFILAVASLRLLGAAAAVLASLAAAAIHVWRFHGRHRVQKRSSRVAVLFLLAVASLHRVRHRSSRVAVVSLGLLGAAAEIYAFAVSCFLRVLYLFYQNSKRACGCFRLA